ncbi:MAG TPA: hypothetical protein VMX56_00935 [Anaerolineales bacterium]|nr:hypothetical protein [Anaerolineales bacterium]
MQRSFLYPKQVNGVIELDPLDYAIECGLKVLTIGTQTAAAVF